MDDETFGLNVGEFRRDTIVDEELMMVRRWQAFGDNNDDDDDELGEGHRSAVTGRGRRGHSDEDGGGEVLASR